MEIDRRVIIEPGGLVYVFKRDHRNGSPEKSQWSISGHEELESFRRTRDSGWLTASKGWGLHLVADQPSYLGWSADKSRQLFLARFSGTVAGVPDDSWHGFPGDYLKHAQDIPDGKILLDWVSRDLLTPARMNKILKQKEIRL